MLVRRNKLGTLLALAMIGGLPLTATPTSSARVEPRRRCRGCGAPTNQCPCPQCGACSSSGGAPGDGCGCGSGAPPR